MVTTKNSRRRVKEIAGSKRKEGKGKNIKLFNQNVEMVSVFLIHY
jgi:hypothetical protein